MKRWSLRRSSGYTAVRKLSGKFHFFLRFCKRKQSETYIIAPHPQLEERNPNIFQHEIAIISDDKVEPFLLVAVTNLDQAKTLHIGKGDIIGFARPEPSR